MGDFVEIYNFAAGNLIDLSVIVLISLAFRKNVK